MELVTASRRRFGLVLAAASVVVAGAALAPAGTESATRAGGASPRTVVRVDAVIGGFAQDGGRLAWTSCPLPHTELVTLREARGTSRTIARVPADDCTYQPNTLRQPHWAGIALAGTSVLFWDENAGGTSLVLKSASSSRGPRQLETVLYPANESFVEPRGDGPDLVYALVAERLRDADRCLGENVGCEVVAVEGRVMRVVDGRAVRIRGIAASAPIDVAAGRLARVPIVPRGKRVGQRPSLVEIRHARTGALMRTIPLGGRPAALALSSTTVAALIAPRGEGPRIERYGVRTGRRIGITTVEKSIVGPLDAEGRAVVYHAGREIRLLDARGVVRPLARTISVRGPIGLSIDGRQVAWAENLRSRGVVRAVAIPASMLE